MLWLVFFLWTWFLMMPSPTSSATRICPGQGALTIGIVRLPFLGLLVYLIARVRSARLAMQPVADQNAASGARVEQVAASNGAGTAEERAKFAEPARSR